MTGNKMFYAMLFLLSLALTVSINIMQVANQIKRQTNTMICIEMVKYEVQCKLWKNNDKDVTDD